MGFRSVVPRHRHAGRREWCAHSSRSAEGLGGKQSGGTRHIAASGGHPEGLQQHAAGGKKVSLADLIVLGGGAAIEKAAKNAGYDVTVPFMPGRADASQEQTDVASFAYLEPAADGFRNYFRTGQRLSPPEMLVDRAKLLTLTVPEMTVLVGGMRTLNANAGQAAQGIFTDRPGTLSNDFFVNLLDMSTQWSKSTTSEGIYEGRDRETGKLKWTATPVDLMFGSSAELRAVAEIYAADDGGKGVGEDEPSCRTS
jgi:catalase-peroxidase